jgi:single-strand DNA-binding protein
VLPKVAEVGKLWKDPELRFTPAGKAVCDIPLVFSKRKKTDAGGYVDAGTFWVHGTVWDQCAENCAETLAKGDQVIVMGELYEDEYTDKKTNEKRKSVKLRIYDIGPILKWNSAKINRAERSSRDDTPPDEDPWASAPAPSLDSGEEPPF